MKAARQQQLVELLNQHYTLTTAALSHFLRVPRFKQVAEAGKHSAVNTGRREHLSETIVIARSLNPVLPSPAGLRPLAGNSTAVHTLVNFGHSDKILSQVINAHLYLQRELIFFRI